jgi:hypothetical protein
MKVAYAVEEGKKVNQEGDITESEGSSPFLVSEALRLSQVNC